MFNDNKPLVSIVIPIYNVEKHLEKCLTSVREQTYQNIEVVLVNDGSPDKSPIIAAKYVENDNRFLLINQENGGLSNARNTGMKSSKGKYLYFLDSDDYLNSNSIEIMVAKMEKYNLEVAFFNANVITAGGIKKYHSFSMESNVISGLNLIKKMVEFRGIYAPVWMYMYNREYIKKNNFEFYEGILHEDEEWTPRVLLKTERVCYSNEVVLNHIKHEGSITGTTNYNAQLRRFNNYIFVLNRLEEVYNDLKNKDRKVFLNYIAKLYIGAITKFPGDIKQYKKVRNIDFVKRNSKSFYMKFVYIIYKFFPRLLKKILL